MPGEGRSRRELTPTPGKMLAVWMKKARPMLAKRLPDTRSFVSLDCEFVREPYLRDCYVVELAAIHYENGRRVNALEVCVDWSAHPGIDLATLERLDAGIRRHAIPPPVNCGWRFESVAQLQGVGEPPAKAFGRLRAFLEPLRSALLVSHNFLGTEGPQIREGFRRIGTRWKWHPDYVLDTGLWYFAAKRRWFAIRDGHAGAAQACLPHPSETLCAFYRRLQELTHAGANWDMKTTLAELDVSPSSRPVRSAGGDAESKAHLAIRYLNELALDSKD